MPRSLITDGWTLQREGKEGEELVRLPHDAMIGEHRSATAASGNHGGYFPGGLYRYSRRLALPQTAGVDHYRLFFEGIQGDARVLLDGTEVATSRDAYREFSVDLSDIFSSAEPLLEVIVDARDAPRSRWYTGAGMYRPVWLDAVPLDHFVDDGVHIATRLGNDASATVSVRAEVVGPNVQGAAVTITLSRAGKEIAHASGVVSEAGSAEVAITIHNPDLWSADNPDRYDVSALLEIDGTAVDSFSLRTGLRTVSVNAQDGLLINGETVVLRGAAVHHDNGILGAATFATAERRRAKLLKENGFNAVRSAHNPLSRAFIEACDDIGLYVMDELTDVWFAHKTPRDGADHFISEWRSDAESMIAKDRNSPSVILYSIGNEIAETASPAGVELSANIDAFFKSEDATRPTTIAVNPLLNMMARRGSSPFESDHYSGDQHDATAGKRSKNRPATSTVANLVTARLGKIMGLMARLPAADRATRDIFDTVDVAGYNYAFGRYVGDRKKYPSRVIVGSESMPGDLPAIRARIDSVPGVIGDFLWTGWDYLGEAGIGTWSYGKEFGGINKPYPALVAGCGLFDITGTPEASSLLARAVWDPTSAPGIAVRPLDRATHTTNRTPWRPSDGVPSWSWGALTGQADIEVYSPSESVELFVNGRSLGRKRTGAHGRFVATFRTPYEQGEVTAVAFSHGAEVGRSSLHTSGHTNLRLRSETASLSGPDDLAFVWIELADVDGTVDQTEVDRVTITISGPGRLAGLGGSDPFDVEPFTEPTHGTYRGRLLAIVRGGDTAGDVTVTAISERHGEATIAIPSVPFDKADRTTTSMISQV